MHLFLFFQSLFQLPLSLLIYYFMCSSVLPACLSVVPHVCLVPGETRRGSKFPGTEVSDVCKPLCGCWDRKLDPLGMKLVVLPRSQISSCYWFHFTGSEICVVVVIVLFLHLHHLSSYCLGVVIAGLLDYETVWSLISVAFHPDKAQNSPILYLQKCKAGCGGGSFNPNT